MATTLYAQVVNRATALSERIPYVLPQCQCSALHSDEWTGESRRAVKRQVSPSRLFNFFNFVFPQARIDVKKCEKVQKYLNFETFSPLYVVERSKVFPVPLILGIDQYLQHQIPQFRTTSTCYWNNPVTLVCWVRFNPNIENFSTANSKYEKLKEWVVLTDQNTP